MINELNIVILWMNIGTILHQILEKKRKVIRKKEKLQKVIKNKYAIVLIETCLKENILNAYIHIYVHVYLCICICICIPSWSEPRGISIGSSCSCSTAAASSRTARAWCRAPAEMNKRGSIASFYKTKLQSLVLLKTNITNKQVHIKDQSIILVRQ